MRLEPARLLRTLQALPLAYLVWPIVSIAGSIGFAVIYSSIVFAPFGPKVLATALQASIVVPLVLMPPFFAVLLYKLRQLSDANRKLQIAASTDSLTGCLNRGAFIAGVDQWLGTQSRGRRHSGGALLMIDVDHFKRINDQFGHDSGDQALVLIAQTTTAVLRQTDLMGRIGGEEFAVFLPHANAQDASSAAERIRQAVNMAAFAPLGQALRLSVSIGGTVFTEAATVRHLFQLADQRLYKAKQFGRNRVEMHKFTPGHAMAPPEARPMH